jgi:precorrin-2/cobalt-factor-2 C20-methyltransferase
MVSAHPISPLGALIGIGVGPGDPDLITVKALGWLEQADVVAFPSGRKGQPGVAQRIVGDRIAPHQQPLALDFPYVFDPDQLTDAWQRATDQVWDCLRQGKTVVFACEGDLSFYGTFNYLALGIERQHPEVTIHRVPGVCSPMAAVSALGIPLTVQGDKLVVLPAVYSVADLAAVLDWADVVVLMKVGSVYSRVWPLLEQRGLLDRSWAIAHATQPSQQIYHPLSDHPNLQLPYFSLLVIRPGASPLP